MANRTVADKSAARETAAYDPSPAADLVRARCKKDIRFFYLNVLDVAGRGLGKIHDLFLDFGRLDEAEDLPVPERYSNLFEYLPPKVDGEYKERWLYYRTLSSVPEIQDGPQGAISAMFHGEGEKVDGKQVWQGIIIRIKGDGLDTCNMMPRGHLKTELGVYLKTLHRIIRNPGLRHLIRCSTFAKACQRVAQMKMTFDGNEVFRKLFGNLVPNSKEREVWNQTAFRLKHDASSDREPTVMAGAIEAALAGYHFDRIVLDDVVDELNSKTPERCESVCGSVALQAFLGDPGCHTNNIGTKWNDLDAHGLWTNPEKSGYETSSFMVATLRDAEGMAIYPEKFTDKEIKKYRNRVQDDFQWMCNMYNQPVAGSAHSFHLDWIKECKYSDTPESTVAKKKLDIFIVCDPASTKKKKSDYSAAIVAGQDKAGVRYFLGGIRDKLSPNELPGALADLIFKWQNLAIELGVSFRFAIESYSFQQYIAFPLRDELRKRNMGVHIEELVPRQQNKIDRIKVLATPFAAGRYMFPTRCPVLGVNGREYDMYATFLTEYQRFPFGTHDDILDTMAYLEEMLRPMAFREEPRSEIKKILDPGIYDSMAGEEQDTIILKLAGWGLRKERNAHDQRGLRLRGSHPGQERHHSRGSAVQYRAS